MGWRYSIIAGLLLIVTGVAVLTVLKPFLVDQLANHSADNDYFFSYGNLVQVLAILLFVTAGLSWVPFAFANKLSFGNVIPILAFLGGAFMFARPLIDRWAPVIRNSQEKKLLHAKGVPVEATFKKVVSYGAMGYQVICVWMDPVSQKEYEFKSAGITAKDRTYILQKRKKDEKIIVTIDPDHPLEKYIVDLQTLKKKK